ncbi:DUF1491 family protein [Mesorhizobium sp. BR1-1-16]|uniref:DUF1491 family protein n=1 Tax=Mesorhizobium sp. BR1-1-16 TaxID=2876653 RepID=UPI001CD03E54|nr:DUF1491 family protein [Mesorhizobium sp. BR1-1-16]MBZ9934971.1 DUF1491 family protein [Mesorhizobium sp. BR1-1-16]
MRVTSALWVAAYVRRAFVEGAFAAVTRRGAQEAGAIFVVVDRLDGMFDLYGQAPQSAFGTDRPADRLFTLVEGAIDRERLAARIASETRFDPDLWVVELEQKTGEPLLDLVE